VREGERERERKKRDGEGRERGGGGGEMENKKWVKVWEEEDDDDEAVRVWKEWRIEVDYWKSVRIGENESRSSISLYTIDASDGRVPVPEAQPREGRSATAHEGQVRPQHIGLESWGGLLGAEGLWVFEKRNRGDKKRVAERETNEADQGCSNGEWEGRDKVVVGGGEKEALRERQRGRTRESQLRTV
jgi:hypothetical protein